MSKIIELAKKLKALADNGIGGEKINAEKMLERIMREHQLTPEQIEGEKIENIWFEVSDKQGDIFGQVCCSVVKNCDFYVSDKKPGFSLLKVTAAEGIEIQMKFDFYWRLYAEELEIFRLAFIARNRIYHPDGDKKDMSELSAFEKEQHLRALEMAYTIKKGELLKQIKK